MSVTTTGTVDDPRVLLERVLGDHAGAPRHARPLVDATHRARARSPLCGDEVDVTLRAVRHEAASTPAAAVARIVETGVGARACAVALASASIMAEQVRGMSLEDARALAATFARALDGTVDPTLPPELLALAAIAPARHDCARLPWTTLAAALDPDEDRRAHDPPMKEDGRAPEQTTVIAESVLDTLAQADAWRRAGLRVALATVVDQRGGPCPPASHLALNERGDLHGSISGGCVEARVLRALDGLLHDPSAVAELLVVGRDLERIDGVTLPCGGTLGILLERVRGTWLPTLLRLRAAGDAPSSPGGRPVAAGRRTPFVIARCLDRPGYRALIGDGGASADPLERAAREALASDRPAFLTVDDERWFLEPVSPPRRLVIVGGVHLAQKLAELATTLEHEVVVVEPRTTFARAERFPPSVRVLNESPAEVLPGWLDARTALVCVTHDPLLDDPALGAALRSPAYYIGALGSRRAQRDRRARLLAAGFRTEDVARVHGPVGLDLGAQNPAEIAVAVIAQLTSAIRRPTRAPRIGSVVLAAGLSRRAEGINKLLAPIDAEPMIRHPVRAASEAALGPVVVVTGHQADAVRRVLADLPVSFVHNADYQAGMGTSIAAGARALAGTVDAAMVVLGDLPWLRAHHLTALAKHHDASTASMILAPTAVGRRGHPVLFGARYLDELASLDGDHGARTLLDRYADAVVEVALDDDAIHRDVDRLPPAWAPPGRLRPRSAVPSDG